MTVLDKRMTDRECVSQHGSAKCSAESVSVAHSESEITQSPSSRLMSHVTRTENGELSMMGYRLCQAMEMGDRWSHSDFRTVFTTLTLSSCVRPERRLLRTCASGTVRRMVAR